MRPTRFRTATKASAILAAFTLVLVGFVGAGPALAAGTPSIAVNLTETDGTPGFDPGDGPGLDSSADNGIVRVNDTVSYNVELSVNDADATNTTFTLQLPQGEELAALPPYCVSPGSTLAPDPTTPAVPLTGTSYQSLVSQTLVCNVGARTAGSSLSFPVVAKVRSEVPNATVLGPVTAAVTSAEVTTPVVSQPVSVTVSSALKWDLSKNGTSVQPDSGSIFGPSPQACPGNPAVSCFRVSFPITLSAPTQGKGAEPSTGPITFTDDLGPAALYQLTGAKLAAANADLAGYGAIVTCPSGAGTGQVPGTKIDGGANTATNSVRDSGALSCTQAGPGQPVEVTIDNPDTSLYSYPTTVQSTNGGSGTSIPGDKAYAISLQLNVWVPVAAVNDLGVSSSNVQTLATKNTFSDLTITGLDGSTETADPDPSDDYRSVNFTTRPPGGFGKGFAGVPGTPGNTPPTAFNPGYPAFDGPPGGNTFSNGNIIVAPGQTAVSVVSLVGSDRSNAQDMSAIGCDAWDNSTLQLVAGDYPGSTDNATAQLVGSSGAGAWVSGYNNVAPADPSQRATKATQASQVPSNVIEYSTGAGGTGDASACASGTWYSSPAAVPGNDPTLAAQGIYTAVSRVRVWSELPLPNGSNTADSSAVTVWASIALRALPSLTQGTVIPNYAGVLFSRPAASKDAMLANPALDWDESSYSPANHTGKYGDRLLVAPAFVRVTKLVKGPSDADFGTGVPAVTGGQNVQYQLSPSLTSGALSPGLSQPVTVDDCLPQGQKFDSASTEPQTITLVTDDTVLPPGFSCAPGSSYLHWDLGEQAINQVIAPIVVKVTVATVVASGTYTNAVQVASPNDPSTAAQRSSSAQIQVVQPSGVQLDKAALTPQVQVNRPGSTNLEPLSWQLSLVNNNGPQSITDPNIIDVLPKNGDGAGSTFNGSLAFGSATVTDGGAGVAIWYTKAGSVAQDPSDSSNGATGSTVWCDAPTSGAVVSGSGTSADCPGSTAEVTGLRIVRPGAFVPGDLIGATVTLIPVGDRGGDVFVNTAFARVAGLTLPVGPASAPERVVESGIGDYVWHDSNKNGVQDQSEAPYAGEVVALGGTDDLGNPVSATATTGADGSYRFDGLRAGDYTVTFAAPGGSSEFTVQGAGTDRALDSNPDPATGIASVTLPVKTNDDTVDAGIVTTPSIETTISQTEADAGTTLVDSVTVSGTGGATISGSWSLLGPVASGTDGSCATAVWDGAPTLSSGELTVDGDQTVSTISLTKALVAGCYTFVDSLPTSDSTAAVSTAPGIPSETARISPRIATTISDAAAETGDSLSDSVSVTGLGDGGSYGGTIDWQLLGPVEPVGGACATVDWSGAPVFDSGSLPVTADGSYTTESAEILGEVGCYTFVDTLSANGTVPELTTEAGLASETAIVTKKQEPPVTPTPTPTPTVPPTGTPHPTPSGAPPVGPGLADTGTDLIGGLAAALALLLAGLATALITRGRAARR